MKCPVKKTCQIETICELFNTSQVKYQEYNYEDLPDGYIIPSVYKTQKLLTINSGVYSNVSEIEQLAKENNIPFCRVNENVGFCRVNENVGFFKVDGLIFHQTTGKLLDDFVERTSDLV